MRRILLSVAALGSLQVSHAANPECLEAYRSLQPRATVASIRSDYRVFSAIGARDNQAYIALARDANQGRPTRARLFLDDEIAVLKELNDHVIDDKDLVTSLTNRHKSLLWERLNEDPELRSAFVSAQYSDYKSVRIGLSSSDPKTMARLRAALVEVNDRFGRSIRELPESAAWLARGRGLSQRPELWAQAGLGATPDEAGIAARKARVLSAKSGRPQVVHFSEVEPELNRERAQLEKFRRALERSLPEEMWVLTPGGRRALSADVLEVLRKVTPAERSFESWLRAAGDDLSSRFDRTFTEKELRAIHDYVSGADVFSPGIYQQERPVVNLAEATGDIVSFDFKGQGARNGEQTLIALADTSEGTLSGAIRAVREGEVRATSRLAFAQQTVDRAVSPISGARKPVFSGDDGFFFASGRIGATQKADLIRRLAASGKRDLYRVTFLPPVWEGTQKVIASEVRSELIGKAEGLEKAIRKALLKDRLVRDAGDSLIAIDFHPSADGSHSAGIMISPGNGNQLPNSVLNRIRRVLQEEGVAPRGLVILKDR